MDENRQTTNAEPTLPSHARLPINRCNLPAVILESLTYQQHPVPLFLDGVKQLHAALLENLERLENTVERVETFKNHMRLGFLCDHLDEAGFIPGSGRCKRDKADYLRILRGWLFDTDSKEAAVLKGWVESRFGLLPRSHEGPLLDFSQPNYQAYLAARAKGLYNTNSLEAQLDLLYTYCQYEIHRQYPEKLHIHLYRGINLIDEHEVLHHTGKRNYVLVLNNINSFTSNRERADEFGDYILETKVPLPKLVFMPGLSPNCLKGEDEYLVIGGVYKVKLNLF